MYVINDLALGCTFEAQVEREFPYMLKNAIGVARIIDNIKYNV